MRLKLITFLFVLCAASLSAQAKIVVLGNFGPWTVECGAPRGSGEKSEYCYLKHVMGGFAEAPSSIFRFSFDREGNLLLAYWSSVPRLFEGVPSKANAEVRVDDSGIWHLMLACVPEHRYCAIDEFRLPASLVSSLETKKRLEFKYSFGPKKYISQSLFLEGFKEGIARLREIVGIL